MKYTFSDKHFLISCVYARCNALDRLELGEKLEGTNFIGCPWIVGDDFNVILNEEEKLGGLEFTQQVEIDFAHYISRCALSEVTFIGSKYTWWNCKINEECIFEILDRVLVNIGFLDIFLTMEVQYFIHQGSDHAPLHFTCNSDERIMPKPFYFPNFWCKSKTFMEVVERNWKVDFFGFPFFMLHAKMKRLKRALAAWSREQFGNIFIQIATLEISLN